MDSEDQPEAWRDINPILSRPIEHRSTPTSQRKPPAAIRSLLVDMAARFRPTDPARVQAHVEQLDLLASDMADAPAEKLREAIAEWVRMSRWMPKAADLWSIIQRQATAKSNAPRSQSWFQDRADVANRELAASGRDDIRWIADGNGCRLVNRRELEMMAERQRSPANEADVRYFRASIREG